MTKSTSGGIEGRKDGTTGTVLRVKNRICGTGGPSEGLRGSGRYRRVSWNKQKR